MKVNFETDYRDFAEAIWLASGAESSYKNNLFNFICLYGIVAALSSLPVLMFAPKFVFALANFIVIFLTCFYFFRPPSRQHFANEYKFIYGSEPFNYEVELKDEGVSVNENLSSSFVSWNRVKEIKETDNNVFLIFKYKSALKIPKASFKDPSQIGEFIAFATSRIPSKEEALNVRNNQ